VELLQTTFAKAWNTGQTRDFTFYLVEFESHLPFHSSFTRTLYLGCYYAINIVPTIQLYSTRDMKTSNCGYDTVRYGTVRYGTVRYGTVRYGTLLLIMQVRVFEYSIGACGFMGKL
jgi:hypothetical protein